MRGMKKKKTKKKVAFPRRRWHINPSERVEESVNAFSRSKLQKEMREDTDEQD
jgi:hypothetical protein